MHRTKNQGHKKIGKNQNREQIIQQQMPNRTDNIDRFFNDFGENDFFCDFGVMRNMNSIMK
jgi:hypothetical protein